MKKIILIVCILLNFSLFSSEIINKKSDKNNIVETTKDVSKIKLYKDYISGEDISKYHKLEELSEVECSALSIPLFDISTCYFVSDKETLGEEKDLTLYISIINNKINTVHLVKESSEYEIKDNLWNYIYKNGFKNYSILSENEDIPIKEKIKDEKTFITLNKSYVKKALESKEEFPVDNLFIDTNVSTDIYFEEILTSDNHKYRRELEVIELYLPERQEWVWQFIFVDFNNQIKLANEYQSNLNK